MRTLPQNDNKCFRFCSGQKVQFYMYSSLVKSLQLCAYLICNLYHQMYMYIPFIICGSVCEPSKKIYHSVDVYVVSLCILQVHTYIFYKNVFCRCLCIFHLYSIHLITYLSLKLFHHCYFYEMIVCLPLLVHSIFRTAWVTKRKTTVNVKSLLKYY